MHCKFYKKSDVYDELSDIFEKNKNNISNINKYALLGIFLGSLTIGLIVFLYKIFPIWIEPKNYETYYNLGDLPDPIQTKLNGDLDHINFVYKGDDISIELLATYDIYGKVINIEKHDIDRFRYSLGPRDFVLGRGKFSNKTFINKFSWYGYNRTSICKVKKRNIDWFNKEFNGDFKEIRINYSNNHVIPSNEKTKRLIKKVKKGDIIRLQGYLVNVRTNENGNWGPSSLDRSDNGCEIIYVTDISWIR